MSEHLAQAPVIGLVADSTIDEIVEGGEKNQGNFADNNGSVSVYDPASSGRKRSPSLVLLRYQVEPEIFSTASLPMSSKMQARSS